MQLPLSAAAIATVKATVPALRQHGLAITTKMYATLFGDPAIKVLFDGAVGAEARQPRTLAAAVLAYAENIDNLPALAGAVESIAARHVERKVEPQHYEAVGDALLGAISEVLARPQRRTSLKPGATPTGAWRSSCSSARPSFAPSAGSPPPSCPARRRGRT